MLHTRDSIAVRICEVAKSSHLNYTYEKADSETIFRFEFQLQCPLKTAKLELHLTEEVHAVATVLVAPEMRAAIQEQLIHMPIHDGGRFDFDSTTGVLKYCLEVRFDAFQSPVDVEFLWLAPLAAMETLGSDN